MRPVGAGSGFVCARASRTPARVVQSNLRPVHGEHRVGPPVAAAVLDPSHCINICRRTFLFGLAPVDDHRTRNTRGDVVWWLAIGSPALSKATQLHAVRQGAAPHAIDATSDATSVFYAQNLHNSQIDSDMNRRRRRRRSSLLLLELIFAELLEEPLPRQLVVAVEQAA